MKNLWLAPVIALTSITAAQADGMPITAGRFTGGLVTVLTVTPAQAKRMRMDHELLLTRAQRAVLKAESGLGPRRFLVYNVMAGENDCTCHAWNRALWLSPGEVEIPHAYLVTDREAARRERELETDG